MSKKVKIIKTKDVVTRPNRFNARISNEESLGEKEIVMTFGKKRENEDCIDVVSEIYLNAEGVKVVLKRLIEVTEEYSQEVDIDIFRNIIDEFELEGE